jgi:hypothetical protein
VEYGCRSYFGSVKEKSNRSWGSRGLAPLGCLPLWGREGVILAISMPAQKTRGDFYRAVISFIGWFSLRVRESPVSFSFIRNLTGWCNNTGYYKKEKS